MCIRDSYLGAAYKALEDPAEAERCFKQVLNLSPSNVEAMEELLAIYETQGDQEKVEKFSRKIEIVKYNAEMDKAERMNGLS